MKKIKPTELKELIEEFHFDYKEDIDSFSKDYAPEILEFCKGIVLCHKKHCLFQQIKKPSEKADHTAAHVYVTIDNIYTSMKLLAIGYIVPSGNMYRQSMEAASMAVLISSQHKIRYKEKQKNKSIDFFKYYLEDKPIARPHRAFDHVKNNASTLGVRSEAIERLEKSKKFLNNFSHCSKLAMSFRQTGGKPSYWFIGGGIGHQDKGILKKEITSRTNFVKIIPELIEGLYQRVK